MDLENNALPTGTGRSGRGVDSLLDQLRNQNATPLQPSDILVATAEGADQPVDGAIPQVLALIRQRLGMDVVFVSEFLKGQRVFRYVQAAGDPPVICAGQADPLEASWCARVVDGRLPELIPDAMPLLERGVMPAPPFRIGTHLSVPILMSDGSVFGTLCCFSFTVTPETSTKDLEALRSIADLLAMRLERGQEGDG